MSLPLRMPAAGLAVMLAVAVAAMSPEPTAVAAPLAGTAAPTVDARAVSSRVTLITGDTVEVTPVGGGRFAASVHPAAGREGITFHTVEIDGGLRVLPSDAVPYVVSGALDVDLFDVEELIADGYGDAATGSLPLIVSYQDPRADAMRVMSGASVVRPLKSIGGAAVRADKDSMPGFWRTVRPAGPSARGTAKTLGSGIAHIWLDGRVKPVLDRSVAQIGAPAAWQAGYTGTGIKVAVLDTGVDANHPDLVGKVKATQNFTTSSGIEDHFGHGTHVAATIAGTGAGSGGTRKGVAPGADLLVGKVLADEGYGYESWIIAGMEWAAAEGASVISMSLGGGATDGTDPMSEAVDRITADSGALFVIAAGNEGADHSIGSPGTATAALTVGAVDRDDRIADFSSRGPRLGDEGLKPEITAPGVGIVAARASGTSMGNPVDELYTAASGTSMATPHVAGAAALLAQAHPGWKATRLKDALVSTAHADTDLSVYAQGGGRVDVARAVAQHVYASGIADFGVQSTTGPAQPPVTRTVTYTNDGPEAVTLTLAVGVDNLDSGTPETDAFSTAGGTVTVPGGGSVAVPLTLDLTKLDRGLHSGWVVATGPDGVMARTAVGVLREGPRHTVTIRALDLDGHPTAAPFVALYGDHARNDVMGYLADGEVATAEVQEGTYLLHGLVEHNDPQNEQATLYTNPEVHVTGDTEIVLDARKAVPIEIQTPKPAEQQAVLSYYVHRVLGNGRTINHGVMHFSTVTKVSVTPTPQVQSGQYEFSSRWQLVAPLVQAEVNGVAGPLDINLLHQSPAFGGERTFPLVWAGKGSPAELKAAKVRGATVLLESQEMDGVGETQQIAWAAAAGAAAVILIRPADFSAWTVWQPIGDREPIPAMVTTAKDGQRMLARVRQGNARISLILTTSSPYLYDVLHVETGRIPNRILHQVTESNTMRITSRYADNGGFGWAKEQRFGWRPWQTFAWNDSQRFVETPKEREEWVSAGDSNWQHRVQHLYTWDDMSPLNSGMTETPHSYQPGTFSETWFGPVVRPASPQGVAGLVSTRAGDTLSLRVPEFVDSAGGHYTIGEARQVTAKLWRDGELLAELPNARQDVTTTAGVSAYRLELSTQRDDEGEWIWGTRTQTVWDFRSGHQPAGVASPLSLLQVDYSVPVDLSGNRVGGRAHLIGLNLRHQDGHAAPRDTKLQLEVSFDEGTTWRAVRSFGWDNRYFAMVPAGKGSVSLRVHATDGAGNSITQTVIRAYGLR